MSDLTAVSLFAGIGGIDLALEMADVDVTAAVEIDPDCRAVLARHFPKTALFNDVTEVTGDQLRATGFVPERGILTGGFPCQDLSVAGRRKGLAGARSGLFWHIMRLADELRPRWLLLENVPGLLSSVCPCAGDGACVDNGRAVACGEWRVERIPSPADELDTPDCPVCRHEWGVHDAGGFCATCHDTCEGLPEFKVREVFVANVPHNIRGGACPAGCMAAHGGAMGAVLGALGERGYGFAYRVLDAQFFGVPQRRRRVFIAGCLGDRTRPVQVLLEPEGGEGHPAAGRQARPGVARAPEGGASEPVVTGTLTTGMMADYDDNTARGGFMVAHSTGAGWWTEGPGTLRAQGGGTDQSGHLVVTPTLTAGMGTNHGAPGHGGKDDAILAVTTATLQGGGRRGHRVDAEAAAGNQLVVAGTLRSHPRPGSADPGAVTVTHALTAREGKGPDSDAVSGFITVPVALRGRDEGARVEAGDPGDPAFTVRTPGGGSSYPMIATTLTAGTAAGEGVNAPGRRREDDHNLIAHALTSEGADASEDGTGRGTPLVAVPDVYTASNDAHPVVGRGQVGALKIGTGLGIPSAPAVATPGAAVRRLTPMECERLQGFPDRWTLHQADGSEQSDSARYRQLGNSVAVPCVAWITRRIVAVEAASEARGAA